MHGDSHFISKTSKFMQSRCHYFINLRPISKKLFTRWMNASWTSFIRSWEVKCSVVLSMGSQNEAGSWRTDRDVKKSRHFNYYSLQNNILHGAAHCSFFLIIYHQICLFLVIQSIIQKLYFLKKVFKDLIL